MVIALLIASSLFIGITWLIAWAKMKIGTDLHKNILSFFFLSAQEYMLKSEHFWEMLIKIQILIWVQNDVGNCNDFVQIQYGHINENYIINVCITLLKCSKDFNFYFFKPFSLFLLDFIVLISSEAEGFLISRS